MPKKKQYAGTPAVPAKEIAGTNPVGHVVLGVLSAPTIVPQHAGHLKGYGPQAKLSHAHGFGHLQKHKQGSLRLSGAPKAHRIGAK